MDKEHKEQAYQLANIGHWEIDVPGKQLYWSDQVKRLHEVSFDYQPDLESALAFYEEGNHRKKVQKAVKKAIEEGQSFSFESKIITAKGNPRWVNAVGEPVMEGGRCASIYGSTQDITDRKTMEQQLQQEHNQLNEAEQEKTRILERIDDGFFAVDKDWTVRYWNKQAEQIIGVPQDDIIGNNLWEVFEKAADLDFYDQYHKALNQQVTVQFEEFYQPLDMWIEVTAYPCEIGLSVYFRDITDRKQNEQRLQQNMELLTQLFENAPVGLVLLDEDHTITRINASFKEMFGYQLSELQGKEIDSFLTPPELVQEARDITDRTLQGESFQVETVRQRKDGTEVPVLIATVPVEIDGDIIAIFGIYVDISQRTEAEQQLEEQLSEKQVLLAEIHHRVKNNMAVVSGLLELQKENTENEEAYQKMQDSQARIQTMSLVHEQLYQMGTFSSLQFDEYVKNLGETIATTYGDKAQDITLSYDTEPVRLDMDQAIPCGLLLNELLTNAYKHAFPNRAEGHITISLHEKDGQAVTLEVKDNGIGMAEEIPERANDSLGLSLVYTLAQQLEGELQITTDNGSCFTVVFDKKDD
ncbi:PAS domain-containing sensor histidine kinase [Fodinibius sp. AD559]|uniref:PAS domain-containing sensor histidine kinase n=1 Tax=Fodinibius sp. AD559 TaxID=3424179 RepID=UPI004046E5A7